MKLKLRGISMEKTYYYVFNNKDNTFFVRLKEVKDDKRVLRVWSYREDYESDFRDPILLGSKFLKDDLKEIESYLKNATREINK